ncbi:YciI family protein [Sorangium sp. So ce176]|uniref:YciI family protein n=1 Tax=Sorangium sp. So ce176 TaxID=3133286 RepID=UPI003F63C22F
MRYMIFVTSDESLWASATPKQREEIYGKYIQYTEEMRKAGVLLGGESLQPTSKGARVSIRNGERVVVNGPFGEPTAIGGHVLIKVNSKEEAIEWAAKSPGAVYGTMEVREVTEFG